MPSDLLRGTAGMNAALRSCVATLLARQATVYSVRYVSCAMRRAHDLR